ncbi:pentatricopeptide repeat-containing protein [Skeletonema marinoi]|uniref:Pentatricopeptide repeat-containing protein n=1 Tax=Skeletonema marinoi TaxID=267567 RepID=A0AAD8Y979_9STRA|nr:pentatricopeptide repeat-containing protein [Skeletonema marinoi]
MTSTLPLPPMMLVFLAVIIATLVPSSCDAFSTSGRRVSSVTNGGGRFRSEGVVRMVDDGDAGINVPLDDTLLPPPTITTIDGDEDNSQTAPTTVFTATPVTITPTSKFIAATLTTATSKRNQTKVNSATLRFNNRLNQLAKNWDDSTAPKVEALLLDALDKYQLHLKEEQQEGTSSPSSEYTKKNNNMIIPNTISFTNAITAWARCTRKDSAKHAQALLDQMLHLYSSPKHNIDGKWDHIKPNKISYNSVITAWARSNERGSARKAEELLRNMYDFYNNDSGLDINCKPDARSFNAVINAVARSRDKNCADRAKFLLDEMGRLYNEGDDDLLPDALTFGAIINAYANSLEKGASDKAAQLLMHMESLYSMGFEEAKPTTFVYNACLNAFAKDPLICVKNEIQAGGGSGNSTQSLNRAEKAEQLLDSMEKRYNEEKDWRIKPDIISYSTVINAHANSGTVNSGVNADGILRRMLHRYLMGDTKCRPNAIVFTAAIKAHSTSIDATLSFDDSEEEEDEASKLMRQEQLKASAKRCEDLLQELCLLYQLPGNDRSLKPTSVTFELVTGALTLAEDWEGVKRITALREEGMTQRD